MSPNEHFEAVYGELRALAAVKLASEKAGQTLSATALVHEAWLRLSEASVEWRDKAHFYRSAAIAMRRILIDQARAKLAQKRGGDLQRVEMTDIAEPCRSEELLALDEALGRLALERPEHARLVELRFFGGLSADDASSALGVSPSTGDRMWRYSRAWLAAEIQDGSAP